MIPKKSKILKKTSKNDKYVNKLRYEIRKITKKHPKIKKKIKNIKDLEKKLYYAMVWEVTEQQPLYILENFAKNGDKQLFKMIGLENFKDKEVKIFKDV